MSQLEELLAVRHSVFVVGGPGTGKSQVNYCLTDSDILNQAAILLSTLVFSGIMILGN